MFGHSSAPANNHPHTDDHTTSTPRGLGPSRQGGDPDNDPGTDDDVRRPLLPLVNVTDRRDLPIFTEPMGASAPLQPVHVIASPILTLRRPSDEVDGDDDEVGVHNLNVPPSTLLIAPTTDNDNAGGAGPEDDPEIRDNVGDGEKRGSLYRLHKLHLNNLLAAAAAQQQQTFHPSPWAAAAAAIRAPSSHRGSATKLYVPTVPPSPGSSVHFFIGTNPTGSLASVMTANGGPGGLTPFAPYYFQPVLLKDKYAHYYRQHLANFVAGPGSAFLSKGPHDGGSSASFLISESGALVLCRICQTPGTDASLISPCKCAGSVRYVHKHCLTKWLEINPNRNRKSQMCELCQYTYHRKKKFKFKDWKWPHCSSHDKMFHALFILSVMVMMGCASAFIVCFRKDRGVRRNDELELSEGEIVTLSCGVLFFLSFFLGMYAEIKAHNPIYKICSQTLSMNQSWIIDDYYGGDDDAFGAGEPHKSRRRARARPKPSTPAPTDTKVPLSASVCDVTGVDESPAETPGAGGGGGGYVSMIDVLPTIAEQQVVMIVPAQPVVSPAAVYPPAPNFNHTRACSYTQDDDGPSAGRSRPYSSRPVPATPSILTRHASLPTGGGAWGQDLRPL